MSLESSGAKPSESLKGDIWWIALDPTEGSEMKKTRRCVIISSDSINFTSPVRLVVPLTEWKRTKESCLWCITVDPTPKNGLTKKTVADTLQTRCVSIERFKEKSGVISAEIMEETIAALAALIEYE
ncbi:MAG: type II toxin-antitoxin system PemK/MazF family toxin [Planctomycetota bacterium]|nr:MAG: type II toxin-antitoxin system PemK/MazF family toxin [Planctomycetota bacterium]